MNHSPDHNPKRSPMHNPQQADPSFHPTSAAQAGHAGPGVPILGHDRQAHSAYDPIGLSGVGFSSVLAVVALVVWLIWIQLA